jgi:hypothetical protein
VSLILGPKVPEFIWDRPPNLKYLPSKYPRDWYMRSASRVFPCPPKLSHPVGDLSMTAMFVIARGVFGWEGYPIKSSHFVTAMHREGEFRAV